MSSLFTLENSASQQRGPGGSNMIRTIVNQYLVVAFFDSLSLPDCFRDKTLEILF